MLVNMPKCRAMMNEALSDEERATRAARRNVAAVLQNAVERARRNVSFDGDSLNNYTSIPSITRNRGGDVVCRSTVSKKVPDADVARLVSYIQRTIKAAGVSATTSVLPLKGHLDDRVVRVVADLGNLVVRGAQNHVADKQRSILSNDVTEDVSQPITTVGSTKRELPKVDDQKRKKLQKDTKPTNTDDDDVFADDDDGVKESVPWVSRRQQSSSRLSGSGISGRFEGGVRRVPQARMLCKIKEDTGTFTERWMYLAQSIDDIISIKRNILADTDIPVDKSRSPSGEQSFVMEQFGDVVFVTVSGIRN